MMLQRILIDADLAAGLIILLLVIALIVRAWLSAGNDGDHR